MVNIVPLGNRVLVRPLVKQERAAGNLIIPSSVNKELEEAIVIATGDAVINIKVGDKVLFHSRIGTPILLDDISYKFLNGPATTDAGEIIAII